MEWISIKERLPEEGQIVLVWLKEAKEPACVRYEIDEKGPKWTELVEVDIWNSREDVIAHWMPLPEPPKG